MARALLYFTLKSGDIIEQLDLMLTEAIFSVRVTRWKK